MDQIILTMDEEYTLNDLGDKEKLLPKKAVEVKKIDEKKPNLKKVINKSIVISYISKKY